MSDYISREELQDYIAKYLSQYLYQDVRDAVDDIDVFVGEMPSADVRENIHGTWIESDAVLIVGYSDTGNYIKLPAQECSICHKPHIEGYGADFCPNCGADMRKPKDQAESEDKE